MNGTPHALAATLAASLLHAGGAGAQTAACDQLKETLSARFEASGVRGFSLEAVPADTPQPAGTRVIGNCEAGAYKVLYRRWGGGAGPAASAIKPAAPAPASAVGPVERPARSAAASAPSPAPPPAQPAPRPKTEATPLGGRASEVVAAPSAAPTPAPVPLPPPVEAPSIDKAWPWTWIGALALLVLAIGFWRWRAHRSAYDEAGLPRGPRL
jgi:hypothetical protein